jgi:hypothetical protein
MTDDRQRQEVVDRLTNTQPCLRVVDGRLVRSDRGTWLIDVRIPSRDGDHSLRIPIGKHRAIDRLARELHLGDGSP